MKKTLSLLVSMTIIMAVSGQISEQTENSSPGKLFFGVNYSYLDFKLKLISMTNHSIWDNQDFGSVDVEQDVLDTLNSFVDYTDKLNTFNLTAGMVMLNKPGVKWYIDGQLYLGLATRKYTIVNNRTQATDLKLNSENLTPNFGLGFNISYNFNKHWGIKLNPSTYFSFGTTSEISDSLYPATEFLDESRELKFNLSSSQINLLATYTIKKFIIEAGPGFYFSHIQHEYDIVRTNPQDGKIYEDIIETKLRTENFINGTVHLQWMFTDHFQLNGGVGISKDITVTAGLLYFL